jgi:inhibitor of cysteine peptidase
MFALLALVATLSLGAADNGKTFTLPPKTAIVVTLPSNASTGYAWQLKPEDKSVVRLVSHRYLQPKKSVPGAPGNERWRFAAVGAGSVKLRLVYVRSWEKNKPPARRFGVTIRVH